MGSAGNRRDREMRSRLLARYGENIRMWSSATGGRLDVDLLILDPVGLAQEAKSIRVASTTSTEDTGLFGHILPLFKPKTGRCGPAGPTRGRCRLRCDGDVRRLAPPTGSPCSSYRLMR